MHRRRRRGLVRGVLPVLHLGELAHERGDLGHVRAAHVEVVEDGLGPLGLLGHRLEVLVVALEERLVLLPHLIEVALGDVAVLVLLLHRLAGLLPLGLHVLGGRLPVLERHLVVGARKVAHREERDENHDGLRHFAGAGDHGCLFARERLAKRYPVVSVGVGEDGRRLAGRRLAVIATATMRNVRAPSFRRKAKSVLNGAKFKKQKNQI